MKASSVLRNLKKATCNVCAGKGVTREPGDVHTSMQNCTECNGTGWDLDIVPDYSIEALDNLELEL